MNGEILSGTDAKSGDLMVGDKPLADPLAVPMGDGMDWLKKQQRGREMKAAVVNALATVTLGASGAMMAAGGTGGGGKPGVTASPLRGVPDGRAGRPDYANDVRAGVTPYGYVGAAAKTRNAVLDRGGVSPGLRTALDPANARNVTRQAGDFLSAEQQAAGHLKPAGEAAWRPDVRGMLVQQRVDEARNALSRTVPAGSPIVNEGPGGQPVVTRAAAVNRKESRLSQYVQ